ETHPQPHSTVLHGEDSSLRACHCRLNRTLSNRTVKGPCVPDFETRSRTAMEAAPAALWVAIDDGCHPDPVDEAMRSWPTPRIGREQLTDPYDQRMSDAPPFP